MPTTIPLAFIVIASAFLPRCFLVRSLRSINGRTAIRLRSKLMFASAKLPSPEMGRRCRAELSRCRCQWNWLGSRAALDAGGIVPAGLARRAWGASVVLLQARSRRPRRAQNLKRAVPLLPPGDASQAAETEMLAAIYYLRQRVLRVYCLRPDSGGERRYESAVPAIEDRANV